MSCALCARAPTPGFRLYKCEKCRHTYKATDGPEECDFCSNIWSAVMVNG